MASRIQVQGIISNEIYTLKQSRPGEMFTIASRPISGDESEYQKLSAVLSMPTAVTPFELSNLLEQNGFREVESTASRPRVQMCLSTGGSSFIRADRIFAIFKDVTDGEYRKQVEIKLGSSQGSTSPTCSSGSDSPFIEPPAFDTARYADLFGSEFVV
jgi:hypothetical protein